jgi:pimeloyl-ACP methyl ester carboxylesterase/DNA-binding winged helix-turn-helix (wHTH) protein
MAITYLILRAPRIAFSGPTVHFRFGEYRLDTDRRELVCGGEHVAIEPQVFDLLVYLIRNRARVVSKDDLLEGVWGGRIVSDSTLTSRINAARRAVGDSGAEQSLIRTVARRGFRFVGSVAEAAISPAEGPRKPEGPEPGLRQDVHFCTAADGVRIAYSVVGEGPPLVKAANWMSHLEYDWQSPIWSPMLRALASGRRLIRYDERGNGLSDWDVGDISFDAFVRDLECVIEASGLERFPLFALSRGCAVSIAYAVRHPERVTHLVLLGGYARGRSKRGSQKGIDEADALKTLMRLGWGRENPAFRQVFTSMFIPGASAEQMQWLNDLQRNTTSPENAVRLREAMADIDITELLARVSVPTLVLHCRDDAVVAFEEGRIMAAGIRGSRFVELEGRNHIILEGDPGWRRFLDELNAFLRT